MQRLRTLDPEQYILTKLKNTPIMSVYLLLSHKEDPSDSVNDKETDLEKSCIYRKIVQLVEIGLKTVTELLAFV